MAQFNENIKIAAPNPIDYKYMSTRLSNGEQLPYSADTEVFSTIDLFERHVGLTVNINNEEYWFKDNKATLVPKLIGGSGSGTITGATNIGFFEGTDAIQKIDITPIGILPDYEGLYESLFNYYFRDTDGVIKIGTSPSDNIPKRGYVYEESTVLGSPTYKSWVWNERVDSLTGEEIGWVLIDGNLENLIGENVPAVVYYPPGNPFTNTSWNDGYNDINPGGGRLGVDVIGNLNTGTAITVNTPIYSRKILNDTTLEFRSIRNLTPTRLNVDFDDAFVKLGVCQVTGQNVGTGEGDIYGGLSGESLRFRTLKAGGDTVITTSGNDVIISTIAGGSSSSGITIGNNLGDGVGLYSGVNNNVIEFKSISGGTNIDVIESGNTILINSNAVVGAKSSTGITTGSTDIFIGVEDDELQFRSIVGSGGTIVTSNDNEVIIYTEPISGGSGVGTITGATNLGGGFSVYNNTINDGNLEFNSIVASGDTVIDLVNNELRIYTESSTGGTSSITASNGLSLLGDDIQLGGDLNADTIISGNSYNLSILNVNVFEVKTDDGHSVYFDGAGGLQYSGDSYFEFEENSLITKGYVDYVRSNNVSGITYQANDDDDFIEASGGITVILPENPVNIGKRIIVADVSGNAESNSIIIDGGDNSILDGSNNNEAHINSNFGSITFIYNSLGFWSIVGFAN